MAILAPFSPRLRDLGVIIVGIIEAHVHTYFGHFLLNKILVLAPTGAKTNFWPFLTELADLAETGGPIKKQNSRMRQNETESLILHFVY